MFSAKFNLAVFKTLFKQTRHKIYLIRYFIKTALFIKYYIELRYSCHFYLLTDQKEYCITNYKKIEHVLIYILNYMVTVTWHIFLPTKLNIEIVKQKVFEAVTTLFFLF